jgi:hypothetical protein
MCSLVLGASLLVGRIWLEYHGAMENPALGVIGEFLIRDTNDQPLSREQLRRAVTVMFYWPAECGDQNACTEARKNADLTRTWVEDKLTTDRGEDKNPLHLLVIGEASDQIFVNEKWRVFKSKPELGALLPQTADLKQPMVLVVDNMLQFALMEPLNQPVSHQRLDRVLSKTTFDQYLGNYLAKRTFMGPRRTAQ